MVTNIQLPYQTKRIMSRLKTISVDDEPRGLSSLKKLLEYNCPKCGGDSHDDMQVADEVKVVIAEIATAIGIALILPCPAEDSA